MNYNYNNSPRRLNDIVNYFENEDELQEVFHLPFVDSKFIDEFLEFNTNDLVVARESGSIYSCSTIYEFVRALDSSIYDGLACPYWSLSDFESMYVHGCYLMFKGLLSSNSHQEFRQFTVQVDSRYRFIHFLFSKPINIDDWKGLLYRLEDSKISIRALLDKFKLGVVKTYDILCRLDVLNEVTDINSKVSSQVCVEFYYECVIHKYGTVPDFFNSWLVELYETMLQIINEDIKLSRGSIPIQVVTLNELVSVLEISKGSDGVLNSKKCTMINRFRLKYMQFIHVMSILNHSVQKLNKDEIMLVHYFFNALGSKIDSRFDDVYLANINVENITVLKQIDEFANFYNPNESSIKRYDSPSDIEVDFRGTSKLDSEQFYVCWLYATIKLMILDPDSYDEVQEVDLGDILAGMK